MNKHVLTGRPTADPESIVFRERWRAEDDGENYAGK